MYNHVLVPVDLSKDPTQIAAAKAIELAKAFDATVHVVHVILDDDRMNPDTRDEETLSPFQYVETIVDQCDYTGDIEFKVRTGSPKLEICEYAEEIGADVIVMATHARSGVQRLALGSVTENVIRDGPCPVLAMNRDPN